MVLEIKTKREHTIDKETEGMELIYCTKPYYKFRGSIEAWMKRPPQTWKTRKLIFDTDYPITITGDLRTRSYVKTNYPITVKGEDLRGEF